MLRLALFFLISSFLSSLVCAATPRVIYVTLDGVRWQDVYQDKTYFPKLWRKYASDLTFYGLPNSYTKMEVASVTISLPSYQSQMAGVVLPCAGNQCGRIPVKTLVEN